MPRGFTLQNVQPAFGGDHRGTLGGGGGPSKTPLYTPPPFPPSDIPGGGGDRSTRALPSHTRPPSRPRLFVSRRCWVLQRRTVCPPPQGRALEPPIVCPDVVRRGRRGAARRAPRAPASPPAPSRPGPAAPPASSTSTTTPPPRPWGRGSGPPGPRTRPWRPRRRTCCTRPCPCTSSGVRLPPSDGPPRGPPPPVRLLIEGWGRGRKQSLWT